MKEKWDDRTLSLLGAEGCRRLREARVLVVGLGGVGGYALEMLARSGVGHLTIVDADKVSVTNLNRQIIALRPDIGKSKAALFKERIAKISPDTEVDARCTYLAPEDVETLLLEGYDCVADAIDSVSPKVALIAGCLREGVPVVSSMGAGGRIDPAKVALSDLWSTREDGLARAVRQRLRKMGLRRRVKVIASTEAPRKSSLIMEEGARFKSSSYGTTAIVPSTFGIHMAAAVTDIIINDKRQTDAKAEKHQ